MYQLMNVWVNECISDIMSEWMLVKCRSEWMNELQKMKLKASELFKIVLSNFCPKQPNKCIGDLTASINFLLLY
jgi:hypothetical protein